jgi:hypothetical protein
MGLAKGAYTLHYALHHVSGIGNASRPHWSIPCLGVCLYGDSRVEPPGIGLYSLHPLVKLCLGSGFASDSNRERVEWFVCDLCAVRDATQPVLLVNLKAINAGMNIQHIRYFFSRTFKAQQIATAKMTMY